MRVIYIFFIRRNPHIPDASHGNIKDEKQRHKVLYANLLTLKETLETEQNYEHGGDEWWMKAMPGV